MLQEAADADRERALIEYIAIRQDTDQVLDDAHQLKVGRRNCLSAATEFSGSALLIIFASGFVLGRYSNPIGEARASRG